MAKDSEDVKGEPVEGSRDLNDLRQSVLDLEAAIKAFGAAHFADLGEDVTGQMRALAHEGRRVLHEVEHQMGQIEKRVEKSLREHPVTWATSLLGVIGFGLVLGLILGRRD